MTVNFINADEIRQDIGVRDSNIAFDDRIEQLIAVASHQIEEFTRRQFDRKERTEYFNTFNSARHLTALHGFGSSTVSSPRQQKLSLAGYNIDMGETFEVRYDPLGAFGPTTVVDGNGYHLDVERGTVALRIATAEAYDAVRVVYTAGYTVTGGTLSASLPEPLKMACEMQAKFLNRKARPENIGIREDRVEGKTKTSNFVSMGELCPEAVALCKSYRRLLTGRR